MTNETLYFTHRNFNNDSNYVLTAKLTKAGNFNEHNLETLKSLIPFNVVDTLCLREYEIDFVFTNKSQISV